MFTLTYTARITFLLTYIVGGTFLSNTCFEFVVLFFDFWNMWFWNIIIFVLVSIFSLYSTCVFIYIFLVYIYSLIYHRQIRIEINLLFTSTSCFIHSKIKYPKYLIKYLLLKTYLLLKKYLLLKTKNKYLNKRVGGGGLHSSLYTLSPKKFWPNPNLILNWNEFWVKLSFSRWREQKGERAEALSCPSHYFIIK